MVFLESLGYIRAVNQTTFDINQREKKPAGQAMIEITHKLCASNVHLSFRTDQDKPVPSVWPTRAKSGMAV